MSRRTLTRVKTHLQGLLGLPFLSLPLLAVALKLGCTRLALGKLPHTLLPLLIGLGLFLLLLFDKRLHSRGFGEAADGGLTLFLLVLLYGSKPIVRLSK